MAKQHQSNGVISSILTGIFTAIAIGLVISVAIDFATDHFPFIQKMAANTRLMVGNKFLQMMHVFQHS